jgi:dihydrofolate synthase/folylpolyglutamate synthase
MPRTLADWLAWQETAHSRPIDLGLERLQRVLANLRWHGPGCPVITVGGTNGKGSCVAFLEAMLTADGERVGTFTSPHLVHYNERIRVACEPVADTEIVAAFERIEAARGEVTLTFFEYNALAALLVFASLQVSRVILEVGLGGRLDAVNVIDADAAIITSIALDHCEWLGSTLDSIAFEKSGIMRAGRPAVIGPDVPASMDRYAGLIGARALRARRDFDWQVEEHAWNWSNGRRVLSGLPPPALAGSAQYANAACAIAALDSLHCERPVADAAIAAGLRGARLRGRFEIVSGPVEWILDVAHNPAGAAILAAHLAERPIAGRTLAVCGILADKDVDGIAQALESEIDHWVCAPTAGERALSAPALAERVRAAGAFEVEVCDSVPAACAAARRAAHPGDRIVVFGSFHTVGPALVWLDGGA